MAYSTQSRNVQRPRYRLGDAVQFLIGNQPVQGTIAEYRGPLGLGGQHLYRVEVPLYANYLQSYEVPEGELEPVVEG